MRLRNINIAVISVTGLGTVYCKTLAITICLFSAPRFDLTHHESCMPYLNFTEQEATFTWFCLILWSIWLWGIFGMGGKTFLIPLFVSWPCIYKQRLQSLPTIAVPAGHPGILGLDPNGRFLLGDFLWSPCDWNGRHGLVAG